MGKDTRVVVRAYLVCYLAALSGGCSNEGSKPDGTGATGSGGDNAAGSTGTSTGGESSGGGPSGNGGNGSVAKSGDVACTTELSCVIKDGAERDQDWFEQQRMSCEALGFSRIDAEGTWEDGGACPDADYFASCVGEDREEHHLKISYDTTLDEMEERCANGDMTWTLHEEVEPEAYHSAAEAMVGPSLLETMHPEVVTESIFLLCSTGAPEGLVGVSEYYNEATNLARYSHFVCVDGAGVQAPFHFTQSFTERYTLTADVPNPGLQLAILNSRGTNYFFTNETCWNCGTTFTYTFDDGSNQVIVTDTAGAELTLDLTSVSNEQP